MRKLSLFEKFRHIIKMANCLRDNRIKKIKLTSYYIKSEGKILLLYYVSSYIPKNFNNKFLLNLKIEDAVKFIKIKFLFKSQQNLKHFN